MMSIEIAGINFYHTFFAKNILSQYMQKFFLTLSFLLFITFVSQAQLKTAAIFGNNAVFQQNQKVPVWGYANPGGKVSVLFADFNTEVMADEKGKWMAYLPAMKADGKTYELTIKSGTDKITYSNIVLGEVWLASGQSNMAYAMSSDQLLNKEEETKNANYPNIRYRSIEGITAIAPSEIIHQQDWKVCTPQTIGGCSAVAYFFGRALHLDQHVPVGIIVSARGATGIETWISRDSLIKHPDFTKDLQTRDERKEHWDSIVNDAAKAGAYRDSIANKSFIGLKLGVTNIDYVDTGWKKTEYPISGERIGNNGYWGIIWMRKSFEITVSQLNKNWVISLPIGDVSDIIYLNGKEIAKNVTKQKVRNVTIPQGLLQVGKNVLSIRMYVNYNGSDIGNKETSCFIKASDDDRIELNGQWASNSQIEPKVAGWLNFYNSNTVNFNAMIYPLIPYAIKGFLWYQGENNSYRAKQYSELQPMMINEWRSSWNEGNIPFLYVQLPNYKGRSANPIEGDAMTQFRDAQKSTLTLSPNTGMACTVDVGDEYNIHPGNKQEVGRRLYLIAQEKVYHQKVVSSGPVFKLAKAKGNEVRVSFKFAENGLTAKGKSLNNCFALADTSGKWYWANAKVNGNDIVLNSREVQSPTKVQYAWQTNPYAPLYNTLDLPMQPFKESILGGK